MKNITKKDENKIHFKLNHVISFYLIHFWHYALKEDQGNCEKSIWDVRKKVRIEIHFLNTEPATAQDKIYSILCAL